jgi:tryptophan synthase alpha subunit
VLEQLLSDICHLSHRHEVQHWLDAPGTPEERLRNILTLAREALYVQRTGDVTNDEARKQFVLRDLISTNA